MDITPPPLPTTEPQADFATSRIFALMLDQLTAALPPLETETPAANALRHEVARAMVLAAHPADPIEAALAISAAVAYQASLASNALAASPGLTGLQSNRYARTAIAQAAYDQQRWTVAQAELLAMVQTYRLFQAAAYRREKARVALQFAAFHDKLLESLRSRLATDQELATDVGLAAVELVAVVARTSQHRPSAGSRRDSSTETWHGLLQAN